MVRLSVHEQNVLSGSEGKLKQLCLENIVRYAEILGADELCEVTKATVFCGAHNYLKAAGSDDPAEVFSNVNLGIDEVLAFDSTYPGCYVQSCVAPADQYEHRPFGQSKEVFEKNREYLDMANKAGVTIAGTCAPYLTGWIPVKGEHFVTTESGMTVIGNSLWGAMGNSDGIEAAFWSAICGRTPKWGNHLPENRKGTHVVRVETPVENLIEWDLLGGAIGGRLPSGSKPVIEGTFSRVTFEKLRQVCTTLAITSNCEMCHIVGYTPEARTAEDALQGNTGDQFSVNRGDLEHAYMNMCSPGEGPVDFVSLGCPHYDIDQIKRVSRYVEGKKISTNVNLMVWTVYPIKKMADENGYTRTIEEAGGHIYTSSCPGSIGEVFIKDYQGFVFDSFKQAGSIKSETDAPVYYSDMFSCIDAAVEGRWKEEFRWKGEQR